MGKIQSSLLKFQHPELIFFSIMALLRRASKVDYSLHSREAKVTAGNGGERRFEEGNHGKVCLRSQKERSDW
jgi:hypothetical protein